MATRSLGGGVGLLHRRCRHARDEPAENDDTVFLAGGVLHRGGSGFGLMVPAGSSAAMAEVPPGSSGIGSALFNSCRQIGTAMGLAILGSVAASVILAEWHRRAGTLPPAGRQAASRLAADVAGGQAHLVAASAGQDLLDPAIASFLSGFEAALLLAGVILASAGVVGIRGLRHLQMPGSSHPR